MRFRSLILAFLVVFAAGCTNSITMVEQVYPAVLEAPQGSFVISAGMTERFGVSATLVGKDYFEIGDTISIVVSNPGVVRVRSEVTAQSLCPRNDGIPAVCIYRGLMVEGMKVGVTSVIFKFGARVDTLSVTVTQGKG